MARRSTKKTEDDEQNLRMPEEGSSALDSDGANGELLCLPAVVEEEINPWDAEVLLAQDGMLGAVVKLLVEGMKLSVRPWDEMTEKEQQAVLDDFRFKAQPIIKTAVEHIASKGRRIVVGTMEQVTTKEAIKAVISCQKSPEACAAFGMTAGGGHVAMILMGTESFLKEVNPVKAEPDQRTLDLDGDSTDEEVAGALATMRGNNDDPFGGF